MRIFLKNALEAWFWLAAPPQPPRTAPLWKREVARRGRIISLVMLANLWTVLFPLILQPQVQAAITLAVVLVVDIVVLAFNRKSHTTTSGIILTLATEVGIMFTIVAQIYLQQSLSFRLIVLFPLLVQGIAVAASCLRPRLAFGIFVLNCLFVLVIFRFAPLDPPLAAFLRTTEGVEGTYVTLTNTFEIVCFTTLIWVISENEDIKRADIAEDDAAYARFVALRNEQELQQKQTLEQDVRELHRLILQIAANPALHLNPSGNNQFQILVYALNTLRLRQQKNQLEFERYHTASQAAQKLIELLDSGQPLPQWQQTHSIVDDIWHALLRQRTQMPFSSIGTKKN